MTLYRFDGVNATIAEAMESEQILFQKYSESYTRYKSQSAAYSNNTEINLYARALYSGTRLKMLMYINQIILSESTLAKMQARHFCMFGIIQSILKTTDKHLRHELESRLQSYRDARKSYINNIDNYKNVIVEIQNITAPSL